MRHQKALAHRIEFIKQRTAFLQGAGHVGDNFKAGDAVFGIDNFISA